MTPANASSRVLLETGTFDFFVRAFGNLRALALRGTSSSSGGIAGSSGGRRCMIVPQKAGAGSSNRSGKVQRTRQRIAVFPTEIPFTIEAVGARHKLGREEARWQSRSRVTIDALLRKRPGKGVGWSGGASGEGNRPRGQRNGSRRRRGRQNDTSPLNTLGGLAGSGTTRFAALVRNLDLQARSTGSSTADRTSLDAVCAGWGREDRC